MSNLIPTPIVDKNGKRTTVHKKPSGSACTKRLPPVKLPEKHDALTTAHLLAKEYADSQGTAVVHERAYQLVMDDALPALKKFGPETLERITGPEMNSERRGALSHLLSDGWTEEESNDYMHLAGIIDDYALGYTEMKDYLVALDYYKELPTSKGGHYPHERGTAAKAITRVALHMNRNPHNIPDIDMWEEFQNGEEWEEVPYLKDAKLRTLLTDPTRDRDAIVDIITERSIFDVDQIIEMLAIDTTAALRTGTL